MIYVDDMFSWGAKGSWCHMWSSNNNTDELHAFAAKIGLKRSWAQLSHGASGDFPHYDLRASKRELALQKGAQYLPLKTWVQLRLAGNAASTEGE